MIETNPYDSGSDYREEDADGRALLPLAYFTTASCSRLPPL